MNRFATKYFSMSFLAISLASLSAADDDKKPAAAAPATPAKVDWSGYVVTSTVTGEVYKVDENGITLRISWLAPQSGGNKGGGRPNIGGANMRPQTPKSPKEMHVDYDLKFADQGLVRYKTLPKKTDDKGKNVPYTVKETEELRKPLGTIGYAAERTDLQTGQMVEVTIVRPKDILPAKATTDDLRIKTAVILSAPPMAAAVPPADPKKK